MRRRRQSRREPTIATADLPLEAPPDALVLHADRRMTWRGGEITSGAAYLDAAAGGATRQVRIVPDRSVPAVAVIQLGQELRAAGAESVVIATERSLR